jgi:hypothetical protein
MARVEIVGRDEGAACFRPDAVASGDLHETLAPGDDHERRGDTCFGKGAVLAQLLARPFTAESDDDQQP